MMLVVKRVVPGLLLLWLSLVAGSSCSVTNEECLAEEACKREGLCQADGARCIAATDEHCRASRFCLNIGLCTASNGRCVAADDKSCQASLQCKEGGNCLARNGECVEITKAYCGSLPACSKTGLCSLSTRRYVCIAGSDADCKKSEECKTKSKCLMEGERCVITDAACKAGEGCEKRGECSRKGDACVVATDDDCKESDICRVGGKCLAESGKFVKTKTREGACQRSCSSDDDCAGCSNGENTCDEGVCATEKCKDSQECSIRGQCARSGLRCVAKSKSDCEDVCRQEGLCTVETSSERCVAAADLDCVGSEACQKFRRCSALQGICVVGNACVASGCQSDSHCKGCKGDKTTCQDGKCVSGSSPADSGTTDAGQDPDQSGEDPDEVGE